MQKRPLETIALTIEIFPVLTGEGCHLSASSIQPGAPFRPSVRVGGDADLFDRVLGLLGRVPDWKP